MTAHGWTLSRSKSLFDRARRSIPGGVNSPVRAFSGVGGTPPFIVRGEGSHIWDADGNEYVDYVCSWGPLILGHRHPAIIAALEGALQTGTSFGAPTENEVELAEAICEAVPSIEMVRLVNSGTEATMSALRLARAFTGRDLIVKFEGCYHGHVDSLLVKAGSGVATLGIPDTAGVPRAFSDTTIPLPFNSVEALHRCFQRYRDKIAAVIVEPVVGNMGCVPPVAGFLAELRAVTDRSGALLIFDEVMTGFRVSFGGAQQLYSIRPDLTTLGKVIGGGVPVGAYGGRRNVMSMIAPGGARLSSRNAFRQPAGGLRRSRHAAPSQGAPGDLRGHRAPRGPARGGCATRRHREPCRFDVYVLLYPRPGHGLRVRPIIGPRPVRGLLPLDVRARFLFPAVAI